MIVKMYIHADRLLFLREQMGDKVTDVVDEGNGLLRVTLEVNDNFDVINVFHAGISYGVKQSHDFFMLFVLCGLAGLLLYLGRLIL